MAKLNYKLQFQVYSTHTFPWITDTSENFPVEQSGWNTFKYKWRGKMTSGNADCIRGFGVLVSRGQSVSWKGDLYFDGIKW